jgi:hypothetical protein
MLSASVKELGVVGEIDLVLGGLRVTRSVHKNNISDESVPCLFLDAGKLKARDHDSLEVLVHQSCSLL